VAETLNLAGLEGYTTGGTVHVVINNQIGFTTLPEDARSSTYCTDVAKMVQAPVLHVNGDDPEAVVHVASVAYEYRQRFKRDVVIDLVGYRRWGHNEGDEPSYTQPLMYAKIKSHTSVAQLYGEQLVRSGAVSREELDALWAAKKAEMQREGESGPLATIARRQPVEPPPVDATGMWGRLRTTLKALGSVPEGFEIHPKLVAHLRKRAELLEGKGEVDWATAEALAWGTLLLEGIPVRLSGQDSGRGTFSQRHAILYDVRTGRESVALNTIAPAGVRFEVHDSLLSEAAVMGFEFGYAVAEHRALVMWEAQFGDFFNGAQVIIDQFLVASEQKWGQPTGLTLLLPHRPRGAGARAQQRAHRAVPDPLRRGQHARRLSLDARVVLPPAAPAGSRRGREAAGGDDAEKACSGTPRCVSPLQSLAEGRFEELLDDAAVDPARVSRVVLTSGKLYYDLLKGREDRGSDGVALVRLEQLYPFPAGCARPRAGPIPVLGRPGLGPGGAAEHGGLALRAGAVPGRRRSRPAATALHRPRAERQPRYGVPQGARPGAGGHRRGGGVGLCRARARHRRPRSRARGFLSLRAAVLLGSVDRQLDGLRPGEVHVVAHLDVLERPPCLRRGGCTSSRWDP
jgi:2-oxoglutarate dehydrogenase E1 component